MKLLVRLMGLLMLSYSTWSVGAINLDRTRIIFNEKDRALSIVIQNENKQLPFLAQAWIDDEKGQKKEDMFGVTPILQKVLPGAQSQIRLRALPPLAQLPQDRESLFFFNIREVPPKADVAQSLQIAIHSRVKLFYRPRAIEDKGTVTWQDKVVLTKTDNGLMVNNPTPYHLTIAFLGKQADKAFESFEAKMIAPYSEQIISDKSVTSTTLYWGYINDFGSLILERLDCSAAASCQRSLVAS